MTQNNWSEIAIAKLRKLFKQGLSGREIAIEMGAGFTRNAVIGKLHRLGLSGTMPVRKPKPKEEKVEKVFRPTFPPNHTPAPSKPVPPLPVDFTGKVVPFMEMKRGMCWYPVKEENKKSLFCGEKTDVDSSYCPGHRKIVYIPKQVRRHGEAVEVREKSARLLSNTGSGRFDFTRKAP